MTPPSHSNLAKIAEVNVREAFEMSRNEFANAVDAAIRKIQFAYNKSGGDLYMSSSFGPQSAVLIQLVEDSGLHLPVVCVNIKTPTYDKQRDYKETLRRHFNLPPPQPGGPPSCWRGGSDANAPSSPGQMCPDILRSDV